MSQRSELLYGSYRHFTDPVLDVIRRETYGEDIGQNSWLTVAEHDHFVSLLELSAAHHVLEIASGSGGPSLRLAGRLGCQVTGVDVDAGAVDTASRLAAEAGASNRVRFRVADANARLPFDADAFDALLCVDAVNHLPDRLGVFREWHRVLRPGRRAIFTDPVVVTGAVTGDELALRGSIGTFLFVPPGVNERLLGEAGFRLVQLEDVTANEVLVADRWRKARQAHRDALLRLEGESRFEALQRFFAIVHALSAERRLSRFAYLVEKPGA